MRLTTIALVAAMLPAVATANPERERPDPQAESRVEMDSYTWSSSRDSRLGVMVMGLNPELRSFFGAPKDSGLLIAKVAPDSPAARAGIRVGDIITRFGDDKVDNVVVIVSSIAKLEGPQKVAIEVVRDRKPLMLQATVGRPRELPQEGARDVPQERI